MINTQEFNKFLSDLPTALPLGAPAVTDAWKTWATFGERTSGIVLQAAARSNAIAAGSAQESFARLRDVSEVRDDGSDYAQAMTEFAQGQWDLSQRTVEAFAGVVRQAQEDAADLVTTSGATVTETGTAATKKVANGTAKKTAKKTRRSTKAAK